MFEFSPVSREYIDSSTISTKVNALYSLKKALIALADSNKLGSDEDEIKNL